MHAFLAAPVPLLLSALLFAFFVCLCIVMAFSSSGWCARSRNWVPTVVPRTSSGFPLGYYSDTQGQTYSEAAPNRAGFPFPRLHPLVKAQIFRFRRQYALYQLPASCAICDGSSTLWQLPPSISTTVTHFGNQICVSPVVRARSSPR